MSLMERARNRLCACIRAHFLHGVCASLSPTLLVFFASSQEVYGNPLHITETRERYILDKSYWLVSSFNGNVVPLNGVHTGLKRERKNKRIKYKPDGVRRRRQ